MNELLNCIENVFGKLYDNVNNEVVLYKLLDNKIQIVKANQYFYNTTGINQDKITNKFLDEFHSKYLVKKFHNKILEMTHELDSANVRFRLKYRHGGINCQINLKGIFDNNHKLIYVISTSEHIKEKPLNNFNSFRNIHNISKTGSWEIDILKNKIYWTEEIYRLHEVSSSFKPTLNNIFDFFVPEEIEKVKHNYSTIQPNNNLCDEIMVLNTHNGKKKWVRLIGNVQFSGNKKVRIYGVIQDVTEKKNLELEIQKREKLYHNLLESSAHSIILINQLGDIKYLNQNMSILLKADYEDIIDSNISQWTKHLRADLVKLLQHIKSRANVISFELKIKDKELIEKECEVYISSVNMDKEDNYFLISLNDITEKKQSYANQLEIERLLNQSSRLSTISALSAGITHEINQPLNALKVVVEGLVYLMTRDRTVFENTIENKLIFINNQIRRIENIINDLKGMTYEKPDFLPSYFDINHSVEKVLEMFELRFETLDVSVEYNNIIENPLKSFPLQIEQILINLISNALDALEEEPSPVNRKINIFIGLRNGKLLIRVGNNGPKIKEDTLKRLFEPFFTTKPNGKGTGLGLAICQQIISSIGGSINVKNIEPTGVVFLINLPDIKD